MGVLNTAGSYRTIRVRFEDEICRLQLHRPEAENTINPLMIAECTEVLGICHQSAKIVVLEGLPEVFCFGADFEAVARDPSNAVDPESLYRLWHQLATGPFVSIAHVQGKVNAGGVGFVAAADIVICDERVPFSLSELLFGLIPACVLPFLIKRIGASKAHYLTLMTQPISAQQALTWGLVDALGTDTDNLLRKHLLRLRRLNKPAITRYKNFMQLMDPSLSRAAGDAVRVSQEVFADEDNRRKIARYVETGKFPWEGD
ncbi:enoyl-CoA hydratase/isomerase [Roseateles flavus]|uniref:Enoyl-CoA hydratase/isomerase n=1 Tax=Roseateles flavus TaxID=3149041 RepID=A0ABV0GBK2_9BURK